MNEDIVGYLLGALDRDAAERVEKELTEKPELRGELDRIGRALRPLAEEAAGVDPPPGLAERTVRRVLQFRQPDAWVPTASSPWRLTDLAVAAGILMVMSVVILPALVQSRQQALLAECSDHLRTIGVALQNYADTHGQYYPFYSSSGPLGVAGMPAQILLDTGAVRDAEVFVCPASGDDAAAIPRLSQLQLALADVDQYSRLVRSAGGSYGYTLGAQFDGLYRAPRADQLAGQPILSDRPVRHGEGDVGMSNSPNHGFRGQNVLYPDGHVKFLDRPHECVGCDNIFKSVRDCIEPGRSWSDVVIGSSEARLLGQRRADGRDGGF